MRPHVDAFDWADVYILASFNSDDDGLVSIDGINGWGHASNGICGKYEYMIFGMLGFCATLYFPLDLKVYPAFGHIIPGSDRNSIFCS